MLKTFALLTLFATVSTGAFAQGRGTPEQQKACGGDVSKFCRAVMQEGDLVILACLQQVRPKISKSCDALLRANGQ